MREVDRRPRAGDRQLIDQQITYYRERAPVYDDWFHRRGRHDRGTAEREAWRREIALVEQALERAHPHGDVLEPAAGTGLWTAQLARAARRILAVDASSEVLAVNRQRIARSGARAPVDYLQADLFAWEPPRGRFDFVFMGFWVSHVPDSCFERFWGGMAAALRPGGRIFFVDKASPVHDRVESPGVVRRDLPDGRAFDIVKIHREPEAWSERLREVGLEGPVATTPRYLVHGCLERAGDRPGPAID